MIDCSKWRSAIHGMMQIPFGIRDTDQWTYDDEVEYWIACEIHEKIQSERLLITAARIFGR